MENFKIYGYTNLTGNKRDDSGIPIQEKIKEILITDSRNLSEASTFNEKFSLEPHDKSTFTFDIMATIDGETPNPFIEILYPESVLGLNLPDRKKTTESNSEKEGAYYQYKIKTRTPSFTNNGLMYSISCEDYASSVYSKQGEGLTLEMTGTLREIAEEILGETRKNNLYKSLNKDVYEMSTLGLEEKRSFGFSYRLPYINYDADSMTPFIVSQGQVTPYNTAVATDKFEIGTTYDFKFNVIALNSYTVSQRTPFSAVFQVVGRSADGIETFIGDSVICEFRGNPVGVRVPFTFLENTEYIDLRILRGGSTPWPNSGVRYSLSLNNFKISKNKDRTEIRELEDNALFINHLSNFYNFFSEEEGGMYSETQMTFSISNSNLYNALTSLATLFNGEVRWDYLDNAFYFISNKYAAFDGYRLHPEVNLSTLRRPESSTDFATILHIQGGSDIDGVIPALPKEWRQFLSKCVEENFSVGNFDRYGVGNTYTDQIPKVAQYILDEDSLEERMNEISNFANHMDKIPNFESTAYDFSYFRKVNMLTEEEYIDLVNIVYNDVRKLNIHLNISTYMYYTIYSNYASQLSELSFYISAINTEQKFRYNTAQKLVGENAPAKYTSAWVSYMNAMDSSVTVENDYVREVESLLGFSDGGALNIEPGSFAYNSLMLFGYYSQSENGVRKLIQENVLRRNQKIEEREELLEKILEFESQIENDLVTSYVKENIAAELAGARQSLENIKNYMGNGSENAVLDQFYRGTYIIEAQWYQEIERRLNLIPSLPSYLTGKNVSLHDLLFNVEDSRNLVVKKEKTLESLMDKYEAFSLEARYENGDTPTSEGLLEQALNVFVDINRPRVEYDIGTINISALDEYKYYTHPEVGDKILLDESLYFSYQEEETDFLIVKGYSEDLRDPSSLTLQVQTDDEQELLVRRMLEQTNFLHVGASGGKSNYVVPVPAELRQKLPLLEESLYKLRETELSIINLFDNVLKK